MSTTKKPLKYLWEAVFEDGHKLLQPANDHYSKHDDSSEWNPSSFRDILDYENISPVKKFSLMSDEQKVSLDMWSGNFYKGAEKISLGDSEAPRKLIYYRNVEQNCVDGVWQEPEVVEYCMGFEFKNKDGRTVKRILTLDGK